MKPAIDLPDDGRPRRRLTGWHWLAIAIAALFGLSVVGSLLPDDDPPARRTPAAAAPSLAAVERAGELAARAYAVSDLLDPADPTTWAELARIDDQLASLAQRNCPTHAARYRAAAAAKRRLVNWLRTPTYERTGSLDTLLAAVTTAASRTNPPPSPTCWAN